MHTPVYQYIGRPLFGGLGIICYIVLSSMTKDTKTNKQSKNRTSYLTNVFILIYCQVSKTGKIRNILYIKFLTKIIQFKEKMIRPVIQNHQFYMISSTYDLKSAEMFKS